MNSIAHPSRAVQEEPQPNPFIGPNFEIGGAGQGASDADLALRHRQALKRFRLTVLPYLGGVAMAMLPPILGHAQWWQFFALAAYTLVGLSIFYVVLRSGISLRWRDSMLAFPQVLFGIGLVTLVCVVLEIARSAALLWMCLVIVYDIGRLPRRQLLVATALAMGLPMLVILLSIFVQFQSRASVVQQLLYILLASFTVAPVLLYVSAAAHRLNARRRQQREQLGATLAKMRELATHDGLTGLHNRCHMQTLLDDEVRRQARNGRPFCVAILDIDHFKQVNDHFGHAMGDTVLRHFAALGRIAFPGPTDILARWGGEEFLLIMPETTLADAQAAVAHLRDLMKLYDWRGHHPDLKVAFSAGVCEHEQTRSIDATLELADQALYRAKRLGRDRIETARPLTPSDQAARARPARNMAASPQELPKKVAALLPPSDDMDDIPATMAVRPAGRAKARTASGRPARGLAGLLWGPDPALHQALRLCLVSSVIYLSLALVGLTYSIPHRIAADEVGHLFIVHQLIAAFVPYALIRSGVTARLTDRALLVPQMLWAFGGLAIAFALVPITRAYDLQIFCVVMVFGFLDLQPRQSILLGATAIGLLGLSYIYLLVDQPANFHGVHDGVGVISAFFVLTLLSLQSRNFALVRNRAREETRELLAASQEVHRLMTRDALTGLFGRQHMQRLMTRECERHARSGHSFCVVLIDLDHFKQINDTHGHQVGDEALVGFAQEAASLLRNTDVIGRWGGEEFVLLLSDADPAQAGFQVSERLRQHVAAQRLCPKAPELRVTYSAGVAQHRMGETLSQLLERADLALYAAKARGRNCSVLSQG